VLVLRTHKSLEVLINLQALLSLSVTMLFDGSSFALFDGGSQFRFRAVVERTGTGTGNRRAVEA
jgi:hypothetical protein